MQAEANDVGNTQDTGRTRSGDDPFAFGEQIINYNRWVLIAIFFLFNNLGFTENPALIWPINIVLLLALLLAGYIQYRLHRGHSFGPAITFVLSAIQDGLITAGVYLTGLYHSHFFIFYYPSLLGFSLAFPLGASLIHATLIGAIYFALCWFLTPDLAADPFALKILVERWLVMYSIVAIGGLLVRQERKRRLQAVASEAQIARENEELYRNLSGKMENWRQIGQEIDRTTGRLNDLAGNLTGLAEEIGAGCEGVSTVTYEIVSRSATNVDQITTIGQVSEQVVATAHSLADNADSTGVASDQARKAVGQAAQAAQALRKRTQTIDDLAAAVRRVADQTNLLAFNASIEAIQAGQEGRRFSVVADEVRQVAERAIHLARGIDELSVEMQQHTGQILDDMAEIGEMVDQTLDFVQVTSQTSEGQKASADVMAQSVTTLEDGTQQTATNIQTVSAAVQRQHVALQQIATLSQELADSAGSLGALTKTLVD